MRRLLVLIAFALLVSGCGNHARKDLETTNANLRRIASGTLLIRLVVTPATDQNARLGFVLAGPYELNPTGLPVGRVAYTQLRGKRAETLTFISNGEHAWLRTAGKTVPVPAASRGEVRSVARGIAGGGGIGALGIDTWITHAHERDGGIVAGVQTEHITGKLDPVNAANGLAGFVRPFGHDVGPFSGSSADQLRKAVLSSSVDVWTGKRDKLLRRMTVKAQLGRDVPTDLKSLLGSALTTSVDFELEIANPNRPVHVKAPTHVSR